MDRPHVARGRRGRDFVTFWQPGPVLNQLPMGTVAYSATVLRGEKAKRQRVYVEIRNL